MNQEIESKIQFTALTRQRNFFAGCLGLCIIANFFLSGKIAASDERIIMIPGITKQMIVEGNKVSSSYLEETALLYISALLDLTPSTIEAKKEMVLKHVSKRSANSLRSLQEYFAEKANDHKKFQLSSFFAPKKLHINSKEMQVIVEGILTSTFGKRGFEERAVKYRINFDYVAGYLQLKEFVELKPKNTKDNESKIANEGKGV
jgi:conjugal transfer pilus assembly protein TraE